MELPEAADACAHLPELSRGALRALHLGTWHYAPTERRLALDARALGLIGQTPTGPGLDELLALLSEDSARRLRRAFVACLREGQVIDIEAQIKPSVERRAWLRFFGEKTEGGADPGGEIHGFVQDISTRKLAQEDTVRLAMRLTTTLASITEAFVTLDREGRFTYLNPESERLLGNTADLLDRPFWEQFSGAQQGLAQRKLEQTMASNERVEFEDFYPALGKWIELRAYPYAEGLAVYFRDVSERKEDESRIHHLAFYDVLTGLPNRFLLIEHLEHALASCVGSDRHGALLFIDLDNFKALNDTRGHQLGDLLLQGVADRLLGCVRKDDTVGRIGGDEFVVILQDLGQDPEQAIHNAQAVARKVRAQLAVPFDLSGYEHHSSVSIGVAMFAAEHPGVNELLKQADLAMYHAKHLGRNTVAFFEPKLLATLNSRVAVANDMRTALQDGGQFVVHYQPQFDRDARIVGVEALLRWQHPGKGLVMPATFIPVAEDTGMIVELGQRVLNQACRQLALWRERPEAAQLTIAVNVSVRQFRHAGFIDQVIAALTQHAAAPERLRLELTESMLSDQGEQTLAQMLRLRQIGVGLSLDDFGTGYSSLMYLKRLPLTQLKIDKVFVDDVLTDPADAAIVEAIIGTAHSLKLKVIAEGVETEGQHQLLAARGCDLFQGYLLARPMPLDELEAFIGRQAAARSR